MIKALCDTVLKIVINTITYIIFVCVYDNVIMNSWGNEHYGMHNMMGMGGMMPNMMPGMAPPLPYMMSDMGQMGAPMNQMGTPMNHIGPPMNQIGPGMNMPVNSAQPVAIVGPVQPEVIATESQDVPVVIPDISEQPENQENEEVQITSVEKSLSNRDRGDRRERDRERG